MRKVGNRKVAGTLATVFMTSAALFGSLFAAAQGTARPNAIPLPPMGWSSWNSFSNTVDAQVAMGQAKAMVSTGMAKAGYRYVNIDEGWWLGARDANGNIEVDAKAWPALQPGENPGDMANIVRFIHGLGLKAGIYTDAGKDGCSTVGPDLGPSYPNTGSEGHYEQDFLQFAKWGFDFVKVDWCGGDRENLDPAVQYAEIARAIARAELITRHRLYYSICDWGARSPSTWAPGIGGVEADIWRTGGDIVAPIVAGTKNADRRAELKEVFREFDQAQHPEAQHTGFFNDPDMMVVGMPGLTEANNRTHMTLWAILGGPLIVGADMTKLSDAALATLTNPEVVSIDQDALGLQAIKVAEAGKGLEIWSKPMANVGERAVVLLNRTGEAAQMTVSWSDLGLMGSKPVQVRDVWAKKDLGLVLSSYSAMVPAGDVVLLRVSGREEDHASYRAGLSTLKTEPMVFRNVASGRRTAPIRISYTNKSKALRFAELRVNGQVATRIAFPPTGGDAPGAIWIEAVLDLDGARNTLSFSAEGGSGPEISSISIH